MNKRKNVWLAFILVFAFLTSGIQAHVQAAGETKQGTISVIGNDAEKPLLNETTIQLEDNETASAALVKAAGAENVTFTHYSFGDMITGIMGLNADATHYWSFYVNGAAAQEGAGTYVVKDGDQISFHYESFAPQPGDNSGSTDPTTTKPSGTATFSKTALKTAIDSTATYVTRQPIGEWEVIALKQAGKTLPARYLNDVKTAVTEANGKFRKITDTERYALGILAAGGDPSHFAGFNLISAIYNGDVTKQGLNGVAYALIALDSAGFKVPADATWTREKLIKELVDKQNPDGGWTWDVTSTVSDIDTTGMVLTALAPYKDQEGVKDKVDAAFNYITTQFTNGKIDNSSTAAQVIIAMSALGMDANQLTKDNQTLIQYLLTFQNNDGGFDYQGGDKSDAFSTTQAFMGLTAYQQFANGKGSLFNLPQAAVQQPSTDTKEPSTDTKEPAKSTEKPTGTTTGHSLPETATNDVNLMAIGLVMLLIGAALIFMQRRNAKF
jgi:LPXTG-motif cell wall-anchored protein